MKPVCVIALIIVAVAHAADAPRSRVIAVRDPRAINTAGQTDDAAVRAMIATGIRALAGAKDEAAAWQAFVSSNDVVGIKINAQPAPLHGTHRAVVDAIVAGLRSAGVSAENIWVFDRDGDKMRDNGFLRYGAVTPWHEAAIIGDTGWDADAFFENKLVGKLIWGDLQFRRQEEPYSARSHLPRLLTHTITKLINVPVLQDHDACGLSGCLYNLSLGMADNTRRFEMYNQNGDPGIVEIAMMPAVRRKLVLNIMDALVGGYAGGPSFRPQYSWQPASLFFSLDPVALDAFCLDQLEAKRKAARVTPIGDHASHIATAGKAGLGESDLKRVEVIEVK